MTLGDLIKKAEALRDAHGEHYDVCVEVDGVPLGALDINLEVADYDNDEWNISTGDRFYIINVME